MGGASADPAPAPELVLRMVPDGLSRLASTEACSCGVGGGPLAKEQSTGTMMISVFIWGELTACQELMLLCSALHWVLDLVSLPSCCFYLTWHQDNINKCEAGEAAGPSSPSWCAVHNSGTAGTCPSLPKAHGSLGALPHHPLTSCSRESCLLEPPPVPGAGLSMYVSIFDAFIKPSKLVNLLLRF